MAAVAQPGSAKEGESREFHESGTRGQRFIALHVAGWLVWATAAAAPLTAQTQAAQGPPPTRRSTVGDTLHGYIIPDPYRRLEDQQDQTDTFGVLFWQLGMREGR